ncbi:MAG TPA: cytochrome c-type biogenesis CcmF C-terminal domain-containing protein, partial [Terriglobales bacterium]|nr:cytochrome c-type biogenesis CcmF C-terminal domain-containing protein [Terriglobales bacterium]
LAFNQTNERELGFNDKMQIGPYTLVNKSYTQEDHPNYSADIAMIDVYKGNEKLETMYPEQRFYKASQQMSTIVANHSTPKEDLYLVFAGKNPDTGRPIIKAHLNPLVYWIWLGAHILLIGTIIALFPNMQATKAPITAKERAAAAAEAQKIGSPVGAGD